jgi:hypothetical protein
MIDAEPIYVDLLREAERHIGAGRLIDACRFLNHAAATMDGHPEQPLVRASAVSIAAREQMQRAKALASRAMILTPEPPVDSLEMDMKALEGLSVVSQRR